MGELTAEAVTDRVVPRTPRVSPDGRWVAFVTGTVGRAGRHPVSALWVAPADGSAPPRELAPATAENHAPRWAPDSGSVFFLSDRAERGTARLYRVGRTEGDPEPLTAAGISGYLPLADPGRIVVLAPDERERPADPRIRTVSASRPPVWDTEARPDRLWLLDSPTGAPRPLGDLGARHVVEVAARPDGGALAVLTWSVADLDPGQFEPGLHLVDPASGATRDLGTPALEASSLTWWRDETGWRLCYLGLTPPALVGGRAVFDVGDRGGTHRNLTFGMSVCPVELAETDGGPPLALFAEGLDTTVRRLDPATRRFTEVSRARGQLASLTVGREVLAVVASTAAEPDAVHAGPPGGPLARLGETALPGIRWGTQERLSYRAPDGLALDGLLVLPPGTTRDDGPFPLVTLVHGGPYGRYADRLNLGWYPSGQWLAAAGFAVFLPNARGGLGHGHAFAVSVAGAVGGPDWTDVLAGIDLLVDEGVADPGRLGIGGGSQGGFMAAWAVGQTDRFAAALVSAGVTDWPLLAATGELTRFEAALGGRENSPITHAANIRTPVLILHGEDDTNVPLSQAELLHRALRGFGAEHEYVVYPREGHSIRERDHQIDVLNRSREWFSRWLTPVRPA
ncbi:prolyl oligopeptidase family serine peptidase [Amycolatopsis sp. NPDC051128]|uniref:S9 family peptidase n=1 Tax=Amycolatopsis sp. NPDC051128 TaxID=3155412 RepID=UPI0034180021